MTKPRLLHNIAALGLVQVINYALTLVTLPYVTRVLGVEEWGRVAFAQLVINYFMWMTNWGYYLSATQKIAKGQSSQVDLGEIFMATWLGQWMLAFVSVAMLLCLVCFVPLFAVDSSLYIYGIGLIIGNVLFPSWYLTGLERIREVAVIQVLIKLPTVPLIFLLVNDREDGVLVIAINSIVAVVAGLFVIRWMRAEFPIMRSVPGWNRVLEELRDGGKLFLSSAWVNLYNTLTPTILGIFAGPAAVGLYSIADRARAAVLAVLAPVTQSLFPRMSRMYVENHKEAAKLLTITGVGIAVVTGLAALSLLLFSEEIVVILGGEEFRSASVVLKWLSPLPLIVGISTFLGVQVLLPAHKKNVYYRVYGMAGVISLAAIIPFVLWRGAEGAAMNTLLTESIITSVMSVYLIRNKFFLSSRQVKIDGPI